MNEGMRQTAGRETDDDRKARWGKNEAPGRWYAGGTLTVCRIRVNQGYTGSTSNWRAISRAGPIAAAGTALPCNAGLTPSSVMRGNRDQGLRCAADSHAHSLAAASKGVNWVCSSVGKAMAATTGPAG